MNGNFDIESMKPTNKDINIVFSPSYNVTSYTYQVYKDNIPINSVNVDNQNPVTIALSETGSYKIIVRVNLLDGNIDTITSGEYIIDNFDRDNYAKDVAWAYYEIGFCYYYQNKYEEALEYFDIVINNFTVLPPRVLAQKVMQDIYDKKPKLRPLEIIEETIEDVEENIDS